MKNKLILILAIIIIASVAVIFATKTKTKETGDSLSRILNKNTFILGLDDSFPPMGFRNENNVLVLPKEDNNAEDDDYEWMGNMACKG